MATRCRPRNLPRGAWEGLFAQALRLIDEIGRLGGADPYWTLGGGTVLMLRYQHRLSRDIDIFVPDPQALGYVSPRLSEVAEHVSADYVEGAGYVKLIRPEGEIDFVASPNLTPTPFDFWRLHDRVVRVETVTEIVAKKLWHRDAFLGQLSAREAVLRAQFDAIATLKYRPSFDDAMTRASEFLRALPLP